MFIDEATITLNGGHGGAGIVSFGKMLKSGPDGGNGGRGGDVYVEAVDDIMLLNQFAAKTDFYADNGNIGGKNKKAGRDADPLTIFLPVGTTLIEVETVHENGITTSGEEIELTQVGQRVLIAKGGLGGRGNWEFRSPRNTTPLFAQKGLPGQKRTFTVVLRLIADYGFVGLPNAGKSSLLSELTNAKPKIANYPFTTLTPNLGVCNNSILSDIPGLIEGAHKGRGLGIRFLKHIEKVKTIFHCISSESEDPLSDYKTIRRELSAYSQKLTKKKEIILITKSDLVEHKQLEKIIKSFESSKKQILAVSIYNPETIDELRSLIA